MSDLIDRQAAIREAHTVIVDGEPFEVVQVETLIGLPSVHPERKTGKWETDMMGILRCSECSTQIPWRWIPIGGIDYFWHSNYCPNCGADMREE